MIHRGKLFTLALLALLPALAACGENETPKADVSERPVLMTTVKSHPLHPLDFVGTIEPQIETQKAFRVAGQVVARNVSVGQTVHKGDILAVLDTSQLNLGVQSAEASVSSAQSQLINAHSVAERAQALAKEGFASDAQLESASQSLAAASARVDSAMAQLDKAREQVGYGELTADYDGIVTATSIQVGEQVAAGTVAITVARPDLRDAVIDVPEDVLQFIKIGSAFTVKTTLQPSESVEGKVREIAPGADKITHTVRLKIAIGDAPVAFRIGTTVETVAKNSGPQIETVPDSAVLSEDGKLYVWKFDEATGTIHKTAIEGREVGNGFYVVTKGIETGTEVAVAGIHSLKDGQKTKRAEELTQ